MKINSIGESALRSIQAGLPSRLDTLISKKIMIIGDVGIDEYVMGNVKRISPEAPVPVLEVESQDRRLGLAANVAQNISSLGGEPILLAVVGNDSAKEQICQCLLEAKVSPEYLIVDSDRPTTRKLRVMAEHHHIVRVDYEKKKFLSSSVESQLLNRFLELLPEVDGIVLEDYAKGVLSETLCQTVIQKAKEAGKKVLVDPHPNTPLEAYKGASLMTPNRDEAVKLSGMNLDELRETSDAIYKVGESLRKAIGAEDLIVTRGKEGMTLFSDGEASNLPTYARQVFDVTGAGDTVIAALALAWAAGWSLMDSCVLANFAAGVVVSKVGCIPCETTDLVNYIESHQL